ncbi:AAA family ATPase [Bifidobacterium breve]|uniref:AAA family ATPase n=2 Tax=Bifidobacterium breve TaxID=1685 RepID=UPI0032DF6FAD
MARIDLMNNERARSFFDGDLDVSRILRNISLETGVPITTDTLVLLDEIQECPRALTALKYFCEDAREYHVIATGSYMGIARHAGTSYPVGKVDTLTLRPMDFAEYLRAIGHRLIADMSKAAMIRFTLLDMAVWVSLCPFHHLAIILTCKNSLFTCKNYCKMMKDAHKNGEAPLTSSGASPYALVCRSARVLQAGSNT